MNARHNIDPAVKTLIWDLDGTLLDSFGIFYGCLHEVLHELGRPEIPEQIFRNNHHGALEESIAHVLQDAGQTTTDAEFADILRKFLVLDNAYIEDVEHHLFADATDLAERAFRAGKRQIVVSNRSHGKDRGNGSPRSMVANSPLLSRYISDVLSGDDGPYRKPHRAFLETRFGPDLAELGNTVVIGDQFVDAELAHNIGAPAILVARTEKIAHLERLEDWGTYLTVVPSLSDVTV